MDNYLVQKYIRKLKKHIENLTAIFLDFPEEEANILVAMKESLSNAKSSQLSKCCKSPEANYRIFKASKCHLKIEKLRQRILDSGVEESVLCEAFAKFIKATRDVADDITKRTGDLSMNDVMSEIKEKAQT